MRGMRRGKEGLIWEGGFIERYSFGNVNSARRMHVEYQAERALKREKPDLEPSENIFSYGKRQGQNTLY